jgi:hypothetical protein
MASRHAALFRRGFIPPPMPAPAVAMAQTQRRGPLMRLVSVLLPIRLLKRKRPRR